MATIETTPAEQKKPFVEARHIVKSFGAQAVLNDVSLQINKGELIAILGPSGCGKTTLLRIIAGLERQNAGQVIINGDDVSTAPAAARRCGIVFQSYALFPNLTVKSNIAFGMDRRRSTSAQRDARVAQLLELIGLPDIAGKHPAKLSGGQQQRVALARALATDPAILLLDEPLSALDAKVRTRLRGEIRQIQQSLNLTTILVTHDQEEALTMADRVVVMDQGNILQVGTPLEIYRNPRHAIVADFVGAMNILPSLNGNHNSIAFRPEDARILASIESQPDCHPATLHRVEFRGAFCRVYLSMKDSPVVVDAPFEQVQPFIDRAPLQVSLHLQPQHIRVVRQDGSLA